MKDPGKNSAEQQNGQPEKKRPARYRLYDKIKIPLKTMDVIIYVIAALLILAIIAGILLRQ
jgi:hypothetical protein